MKKLRETLYKTLKEALNKGININILEAEAMLAVDRLEAELIEQDIKNMNKNVVFVDFEQKKRVS